MAVALLAAPGTLAAQLAQSLEAAASPPIRQVEARAVEGEPPRLDGVLADPAWARAAPAPGFVQLRPNPGAAASRPTAARVVYDADAIYVGMRLYDEPDSVVAQLARRDASGVDTDWAHVVIDSYNDGRTAFRFSVTPRGTKRDVLHYDDVGEDLNWDAVWDVAVRVDSLGWTAEFRIPLSQLRFSAEEGGELVWGVNFGREIARYGESAWWSQVLPDAGGFVSESGELHGLVGLDAGHRLELMPYTVAGVTRAPEDADNPFYEANDPLGNIGVDLRYGITSNLTLSATINPDFGQVEADPSVVNLSAFETFYPEKRPFFTEGANIFEFGIGVDDGSGEALFYSRRSAVSRAISGAGRARSDCSSPGRTGDWVTTARSTSSLRPRTRRSCARGTASRTACGRRTATSPRATCAGARRRSSGSSSRPRATSSGPTPSLNLSLEPRLVRNRPSWQYVGQPEAAGERHYVVGALDQTTVSLTTRLNWTLSPTLSLELYAQPFISGGEYTTFRRVADPRADAFADRFEPLDATYDAAADTYRADLDGDGAPDLSFGSSDFNFKQMRGNAVFRWEYRRGSTLYLVWSQSRTAYLAGGEADGARLDLSRDVNRLFNRDEDYLTPVTNVFMIKVSYWLNG
ncbi:MAG TPA: DUF5916 domain-containing protein [Longimicrobiales bacterium]